MARSNLSSCCVSGTMDQTSTARGLAEEERKSTRRLSLSAEQRKHALDELAVAGTSNSNNNDGNASTMTSGTTAPRRGIMRRRSIKSVNFENVDLDDDNGGRGEPEGPVYEDSNNLRKKHSEQELLAQSFSSLFPIKETEAGFRNEMRSMGGSRTFDSLNNSCMSMNLDIYLVSTKDEEDKPSKKEHRSLKSKEGEGKRSLMKADSKRSLEDTEGTRSLRKTDSRRSLEDTEGTRSLRKTDSRRSLENTEGTRSLKKTGSRRSLESTDGTRSLRKTDSRRSLQDTDGARSLKKTGSRRSLEDTDGARSLRKSDSRRFLEDTDGARSLRKSDSRRSLEDTDGARSLRKSDSRRSLENTDGARSLRKSDSRPLLKGASKSSSRSLRKSDDTSKTSCISWGDEASTESRSSLPKSQDPEPRIRNSRRKKTVDCSSSQKKYKEDKTDFHESSSGFGRSTFLRSALKQSKPSKPKKRVRIDVNSSVSIANEIESEIDPEKLWWTAKDLRATLSDSKKTAAVYAQLRPDYTTTSKNLLSLCVQDTGMKILNKYAAKVIPSLAEGSARGLEVVVFPEIMSRKENSVKVVLDAQKSASLIPTAEQRVRYLAEKYSRETAYARNWARIMGDLDALAAAD